MENIANNTNTVKAMVINGVKEKIKATEKDLSRFDILISDEILPVLCEGITEEDNLIEFVMGILGSDKELQKEFLERNLLVAEGITVDEKGTFRISLQNPDKADAIILKGILVDEKGNSLEDKGYYKKDDPVYEDEKINSEDFVKNLFNKFDIQGL